MFASEWVKKKRKKKEEEQENKKFKSKWKDKKNSPLFYKKKVMLSLIENEMTEKKKVRVCVWVCDYV